MDELIFAPLSFLFAWLPLSHCLADGELCSRGRGAVKGLSVRLRDMLAVLPSHIAPTGPTASCSPHFRSAPAWALMATRLSLMLSYIAAVWVGSCHRNCMSSGWLVAHRRGPVFTRQQPSLE